MNLEIAKDVRQKLDRVLSSRPDLSQFIGWLFETNFDDDSRTEFDELQNKIRSVTQVEDFEQSFDSEFTQWKKNTAQPIRVRDLRSYAADAIVCHDLAQSFEEEEYGLKWTTGGVRVLAIKNSPDHCPSGVFEGYWPSFKFQIRSPIYYFQGTRDVSTPTAGAIAHFQNQKSAPFKSFTLLNGHGHSPLQIDLNSCLESTFSAIFNGNQDFSGIFDPSGNCVECPIHIEIFERA